EHVTRPASTRRARCSDAVEAETPAARASSPAGLTVPSMRWERMRDRAGEASALPSAEKSRSRRRASASATRGTALLEPLLGSVPRGSVPLGSVVRPSMAPGYAADVSALAEPSRTHTRTMTPHTYETHTHWSGTTAGGIRSYSRN